MPGSECYAKPVGLTDLKPTFTHCLSVVKDGCNSITERVGCLSSQSAGSSAQSTPDPCVWCGGKDCHGDSHAGCTAFSMLAKTTANTVTANAFEKVGALEVAHCIAASPEAGGAAVPGTPPVPTVPPPPSPLVTSQNDASNALLGSAPPALHGAQNGTKMDCLRPATSCGAIRDKLICLSSKDGRIGLKEHGLNLGGEACVWCGGEPCTSNGGNLCEPYDWLQHGEGLAFAKASSKIRKTAMCSEETLFDIEEVGCLQMQPEGCNNIREKDKCLTSRDGRPFIKVAGFDVHAQPCVWCGGKPCHGNNDNLCEPYDFIINGGGHAFKSLPGPRTVAGCRAGMAYADHLYEDATGKVEEAPALPKEGNSQGQLLPVVGKQDQPKSMRPPAASAALPLQNIGLDCWYECKQTSGFCEFCGVGNACCREGYDADSPKECQGNVHFTTWHHECIVPDHSKSNVAHEQIAIAAQTAAKEAAAGGATAEEQVRQAALAAGQYAKQIDVPPEAAAKIVAAGVEEAQSSAGHTQTAQTPSQIQAATIAAQAAVSRGTPQEQLAEVAQAATQVAAETGKGFQQQAQAAAVAAGTAAGQMGLHAADAAFVAAQGAASASQAAGEGKDSAITAAAAAAHTAAVAAGKSGEALIASITEAVVKVTASAGMGAEDQKAAVTQAADTYAAAAGLSAAAAEMAALHTMGLASKGRASAMPAPASAVQAAAPEVPSAPVNPEVKSATVVPTGIPENPAPIATPAVAPATAEAPTIAPATAKNATTLPTPEQLALQAAVAASAESPAVMKSAAENAAFNAGSSKEQAAEIARAAAFAVSGGSVSGHASATIAPLMEGAEQSSQGEGMPKMPDRKAGIDAAEAGAEAARVAAAEGKTPAAQAKAAAEAAGRTAMNGGMNLVGAEEAARSAAVKAARAAGLGSEEAASVGTSAAEEAASSGAFTAHDIVVRSTPKEPMGIKAKEVSEEDAEVAAIPVDAKGCSGDECHQGRSHLVLPLVAAAVIVLLVCCASYVLTSKRPRKGERSVAVERPAPADVERAEEAPLIQHPAALLPAPPTTLPRTAVPGGPSPTQAAPLIPRTAVAAPTVYTTAQGSPVSTSYVSYVRGGMPAPTGVRFGVPPAPAAASNTVSHGAQAGTAGPAEQAAAASTMALFDALDANGDGVLDAAELAQLKMGGPPPARSALPSEPVASVTRFPPVFRAP
eukprot:s1827_g13.t1